MKISSVILALVFILFAFIIIPLGLIQLNYIWSLPVYDLFFLKVIGLLMIIFGGLICLYCIGIFHILGKGTPVPFDPPKKLVGRGLYKYSRNPMYIGYLLIILGKFFFFGQFLLVVYFLAASIFWHLLIVYYEEPILKKRFGKSYLEYLKKTPRWL